MKIETLSVGYTMLADAPFGTVNFVDGKGNSIKVTIPEDLALEIMNEYEDRLKVLVQGQAQYFGKEGNE
jgi:hypothetical protein